MALKKWGYRCKARAGGFAMPAQFFETRVVTRDLPLQLDPAWQSPC
jgi:hypothetical protein